MRVIDSGFALSERLNCPLHIIWLRNSALYCPFEELFENPGGPVSLKEYDFHRWGDHLVHRISSTTNAFRYISYNSKDVFRLKKLGYDFVGTKAKVQFFRTFRSFFPNPKPFQKFFPIEPLRKKIGDYHRDHQVGVHIRRSDNTESKAHSPTISFIARMEKEVDANDRTTFFLATDDPTEENALRKRFGNRILVHEKSSLNRRECVAAKDALVDLFALAECKKIFASYWSSFSDVAAEIRGIEKIVVGQE